MVTPNITDFDVNSSRNTKDGFEYTGNMAKIIPMESNNCMDSITFASMLKLHFVISDYLPTCTCHL